MRVKFVGDVMLGETLENYKRGVRTAIEQGVDPFAFCRPELEAADLCVANLECVLSDLSNKEGLLREILRAPKRFVSVLKAGGISLVNLANNHTLDHGQDALHDALATLEENGIRAFGYGMNEPFQERPLRVDGFGMSLGFLGYNLANFAPARFEAAVQRICSTVQATRRDLDFLVVSLHWGDEYAHCPKPSLCAIARRLFASGCDLLHGHHSHRFQGTIESDGRLLAPSLGNFIFDDRRSENRLTGILGVDIGKAGLQSFDVRPCHVNRRFQPVPQDALLPQVNQLNRKLQFAYTVEDTDRKARLEASLGRMVARGHFKNRVRMRLLMLFHLPNYWGHLRTLWRYGRQELGRQFSVTDS